MKTFLYSFCVTLKVSECYSQIAVDVGSNDVEQLIPIFDAVRGRLSFESDGRRRKVH